MNPFKHFLYLLFLVSKMRLWTKATLRNATRLLFTGMENCSVVVIFKLLIVKYIGNSYTLTSNHSKSATFRIYLSKVSILLTYQQADFKTYSLTPRMSFVKVQKDQSSHLTKPQQYFNYKCTQMQVVLLTWIFLDYL